jgi:sarcosine/dimethylglycine N-methyltransferase
MPVQGFRPSTTSSASPAVVDFYDRHPINETQILAALARRGKSSHSVTPEDLFEWDQDHYGGVSAVEALARRAHIGSTTTVLDVCAGLGGPARVLARLRGCRVTGVDLNHGRCVAGRRLTAMVGLSDRVRLVNGNAMALPFRRASFTAVVSQEGFLHVADKGAALRECARVLVPGGRLAFTDWIATPRLEAGERRRLEEWMAAISVQTIPGYRALLGRSGFSVIDAEDLSEEWIEILHGRLRMYRALREDTVARLGQQRYDEYDQLYRFFVGLVAARKLGGGRFSATAYPGTS